MERGNRVWQNRAVSQEVSAKRLSCCWVSGMDGVLDEPMGVDLVNRICSGRLREAPSVLLVDDVQPVLMLQAMWLRTAGFEVSLTTCSTRHWLQ